MAQTNSNENIHCFTVKHQNLGEFQWLPRGPAGPLSRALSWRPQRQGFPNLAFRWIAWFASRLRWWNYGATKQVCCWRWWNYGENYGEYCWRSFFGICFGCEVACLTLKTVQWNTIHIGVFGWRVWSFLWSWEGLRSAQHSRNPSTGKQMGFKEFGTEHGNTNGIERQCKHFKMFSLFIFECLVSLASFSQSWMHQCVPGDWEVILAQDSTA